MDRTKRPNLHQRASHIHRVTVNEVGRVAAAEGIEAMSAWPRSGLTPMGGSYWPDPMEWPGSM